MLGDLALEPWYWFCTQTPMFYEKSAWELQTCNGERMRRILKRAQHEVGALAAEVEVIVTLMIIAAGFIGLASLFPVASGSLVSSDHQTHAAVSTEPDRELVGTKLFINESPAGSLSGYVRWGNSNGEKPMARQQLFLKGVEGASLDRFYEVRADSAGHYRFAGIEPGTYVLTNRVAGPPIWRLRVVVEAEKENEINLSPQNSVKVRDDFPNGLTRTTAQANERIAEKIRTRYNPSNFAILCQFEWAGSQITPPLGMEGKGEWYQPERDVKALRSYRL